MDVEKKIVVLEDGKDTVAYDKLILATGGTPRRLPVEGANLDNVYTFRGIDDAKKVDAGELIAIGCGYQRSVWFYSGTGGKANGRHR